jgi:hypothetical protein
MNNNNVFLYVTGTVFVAGVSAVFIFGWAQDTMAVPEQVSEIAAPAEIVMATTDRLVRVVLASPYGR